MRLQDYIERFFPSNLTKLKTNKMKRLLFLCAPFALCLFSSCLKDEAEDKEKIVTMTIYPETGYGASLMSDIITEPLIFSDSDNNEKHQLSDIITEGFKFDYQRGYQYTLKVKKVWMQNPPQDVSSIKYVFIELLAKEKKIVENSEKNINLSVSSTTVKFSPQYPSELDNNGKPKVYDALYVKEVGTNSWMALRTIEGFDFEKGYEYELNVKKVVEANPYSIKYVLLKVVSKTKK